MAAKKTITCMKVEKALQAKGAITGRMKARPAMKVEKALKAKGTMKSGTKAMPAMKAKISMETAEKPTKWWMTKFSNKIGNWQLHSIIHGKNCTKIWYKIPP